VRSRLLTGTLRHQRLHPTRYAFRHDVAYLELDLDELPVLDGRLRLLSYNRRAALSVRDADHFDGAQPLADAVRAALARAGHDSAGWTLTLVAYPRVLGYVFNPVSFVLCRDAGGRLAVVLAEVHNTHGERHVYTLEPRAGAPGFRAAATKEMYVSPFIDMDARYEIAVHEESDELRFAIAESEHAQPLLAADLRLRRQPLTDIALARALVRYPLVTLRTTALIHLHALRLWLRGVRFLPHGDARRDGPGGSP
jgi:DUF1365 family protein